MVRFHGFSYRMYSRKPFEAIPRHAVHELFLFRKPPSFKVIGNGGGAPYACEGVFEAACSGELCIIA